MSITTTDPIADMLTRIRNAIAVGKNEVSLPNSNVKQAVAKLLADRRFIDSVSVEDATVGKQLKLRLYEPGTSPRITEIVRVSRPGRREYVKADKMPVVKRGRGLVIVSTSQGLMSGSDAKSLGIGGEVMCKVY